MEDREGELCIFGTSSYLHIQDFVGICWIGSQPAASYHTNLQYFLEWFDQIVWNMVEFELVFELLHQHNGLKSVAKYEEK